MVGYVILLGKFISWIVTCRVILWIKDTNFIVVEQINSVYSKFKKKKKSVYRCVDQKNMIHNLHVAQSYKLNIHAV